MKNCWIFCGLPFSSSVTFSALRPGTKLPFLSRKMASTSTSAVVDLKVCMSARPHNASAAMRITGCLRWQDLTLSHVALTGANVVAAALFDGHGNLVPAFGLDPFGDVLQDVAGAKIVECGLEHVADRVVHAQRNDAAGGRHHDLEQAAWYAVGVRRHPRAGTGRDVPGA